MATIALAPQRPLGVPGVVRMLANETDKGLRIWWAHKVTLIPQLALMATTYLLFQAVLGGGHLVQTLLPVTLLAYLAYVAGYMALLKTAAGLLEEVNGGTLEQTHLSPLPSWALSLGRMGAVLVEALLTAAIIGVALVLALHIQLPLGPAAVVPLALTLADIVGFALFIAALALTVPSIGAILHVIQSGVMFFNGGLLPLSAFPHWLEVFAKLVPTTLGLDATRRIMFGHETLAGVWADHSLSFALVHAAVLVAVGWAAYQTAIRRGLRDGRLGPR
ncbi:MAG: ABC transporter permease [Chloroflexota bacterium]|nr:ABC transporter permease [Chloroflexota bacterium]